MDTIDDGSYGGVRGRKCSLKEDVNGRKAQGGDLKEGHLADVRWPKMQYPSAIYQSDWLTLFLV